MGVIETKTFKSGNSVAVLLPQEFGVGPDVAMTIEQHGTTLTIKPTLDQHQEQRNLMQMMEEIETIWATAPKCDVQPRDPIEFPDRPGLY